MRYALVMAFMAVLLATTAFAGVNDRATLPLHGKASSFEPCIGYLPVDCVSVPPDVDIAAGPTAIFLFVFNHVRLGGVQTAFQPNASWGYTFSLWDCRGNQLNAVTPAPPWGPTAGSIVSAFDCVQNTELCVIGRMFFIANTGCIEQVQSGFPFGTHVIDCNGVVDEIDDPLRLGKVCVGPGGNTACVPPVAVEPATWGSIKAQYN